MKLPEKWDDITLKQFLELIPIKNDIIKIINVLSGVKEEKLKLLPTDAIELMVIHLLFLNTELKVKPSNKIKIGKDEYFVNYLEKLKFGEYVDSESVLKQNNWCALLGILCRKKGEVYDDDFIANKLDKRIELFEKQPITKIYPIINFFLQLKEAYLITTQKYFQMKEQAESLVQSTETLLKAGGGNILDMILHKIKLKKLKKLIKCI